MNINVNIDTSGCWNYEQFFFLQCWELNPRVHAGQVLYHWATSPTLKTNFIFFTDLYSPKFLDASVLHLQGERTVC
jgi:hypothetical protein